MSEFVQVMKDWRRMCQAMDKEFGSECCAHCPLDGCSAVYDDIDGSEDYAENERQIEAWAAEHPEPVYPTWEEWLVANGIMEPDNVRLNGDYRFYCNGKPVYNIPSPKMFEPIPADIAEKLGVEPKKVST